MGELRTVVEVESMGLKESASGGALLEDALNAEEDEVIVRELRTGAVRGAGIDELEGLVNELVTNC